MNYSPKKSLNELLISPKKIEWIIVILFLSYI